MINSQSGTVPAHGLLSQQDAPDQRQHISDIPSATPWAAVSDLSVQMFYFKTMHDSAIKRVDLGDIDFSTGGETARAIDQGRFTFQDVTP